MNKILLLIILGAISTEIYANPYDQCLYILDRGAFNAEISYDTSNKKQIMKNYLCSQDIVSDKDSRKSKFVFASIVVGVFSDDSDYDRNKLEVWKTNNCHENDLYDIASAISYQYLQVVIENMVEIWKKCIAEKNNGLVCWAEPLAKDQVLFYIQDRAKQSVSIKTTGLKLFNANEITAVAEEVQLNIIETVVLKHEDIYDSATIIYEGRGSESNVSCQYVIPARMKNPNHE